MFQAGISDKIIKGHAADEMTFKRGCLYYLNRRVTNFRFSPDRMAIYAHVTGDYIYDVKVNLSTEGLIKSFSCSCMAFNTYHGACKHIIATMKAAQEKLKDTDVLPVQNKKQVNEILAYFDDLNENRKKEEISLEIFFEFTKDYYSSLYSSVEFHVGKNKLYVVKNIKDFLNKIEKSHPIEFGKNFILDPLTLKFSHKDQEIIDFFLEILENESSLEDSSESRYTSIASSFKGKKAYLSNPMLKKFLQLMSGKPFKASILGMENENMQVLDENLPLEFSIKQEKNNLSVHLNVKDIIIPLTNKGEYFYCLGNIYHPSSAQRDYFLPFYSSFLASYQRTLTVFPDEKERFVSGLLPYLKQIGTVAIEDELAQNICEEELSVKIYFDKEGKGISAKLEFHYGERVINPFSPRTAPIEIGNKILLRNMEKEGKVLELFEKSAFIVAKDRICLNNENKILEFIEVILPDLQKIAEVYYSENLKTLKIRPPSAISGGIRFNENSNMLEFTLDFEGIERDELEFIFNSLKEKRKYYRLKDGTFIPLNTPEYIKMGELLDNLDISSKNLSEFMIELPKYRALYIDSFMEDLNFKSMEQSLAFKRLVQNIREPEDMDFEIPPNLQNILRDYQKTGFKWLKTLAFYGLGGILADDMGLGKTLQVIAFIMSEKQNSSMPSLVIAPSSLVYNWLEEVNKFAPSLKVAVISGMQNERADQLKDIGNADLVVTSYPLIRRDIDVYQKFEFSYCFLDEAQHVKNPNTINAKSVKQIKAKSYFALTGTPIENSLTELWSIFDFIMPGYLLTHARFVKKYEIPIIKDQDQKALNDLSRHLKPFILRRLKKDVLKELPDKIESKLTSEMTAEQKKIYMAYLANARGEITREIEENGFEKSRMKILSCLTRLRQICCHPSLFLDEYNGESGKMLLLKETIDDALGSGHRILLFSQFTSMLNIIRQTLEKDSIPFFYLDGSTKVENRMDIVKHFNRGIGKVFLISLKAGGFGLNLTGADMVIHYDPWWNPAVEEQAADRAYRIGQEKAVHVIKLITKDTIEEKIFQLQQRKKELIDSVIQPGETLLTKMTQEEIQNLFEL